MRLIRDPLLAAAVLAGSVAVAADDHGAIGEPVLRLSTSLARVPSEALQAAQPAASASSFSDRTRQPVQVLRQATERSERELLDALTAARQHQQTTAEMERRLAQARAQRYANPVVYVLATLLAAAIAGAAMFWRRMHSARRCQPAA